MILEKFEKKWCVNEMQELESKLYTPITENDQELKVSYGVENKHPRAKNVGSVEENLFFHTNELEITVI